MFKRLIALSLIFLFVFGMTSYALDYSSNELEQYKVAMSEAQRKYFELMNGNYRGTELKSKFIELFGEGYTNEDILNNYDKIFDMEKGNVDQGLIALLTLDDYHEIDDILSDAYKSNLDNINNPEDLDYLTYEEAEIPQEIPILDEREQQDENLNIESDENEQNLENFRASNGFTDITLISLNDTSATFDIWYVNNTDVNNIFKKYDSYNKVWMNILGRDGNPAASTRRITVSGLNPGAVYKFVVTTYNRTTSTWMDNEILVRTIGLKTPKIEVAEKTSTSITFNAVFPSEFQWGNRILYYDIATLTWINATNATDLYVKSGTYVKSNLAPGIEYRFLFSYYDGLTSEWTHEYINATTVFPAENLITYEYSNMTFKLDSLLVNELTLTRAQRMMSNINNGYNIMYELVGGDKPYNGDKMVLKGDRTLEDDIEGQAGQPILWKTTRAIEHAIMMKALNADNTETPFHEIGHNFDSPNWTFEPEALTIIKIYYYFSTTNQGMVVNSQNRVFTGKQYKDYIKSYANRLKGHINYDAAMAKNVYSPYSLAYNLANIADITGWDAFKQTFRYLGTLPSSEVPKTKISKFNLFMTKLKDYSGVDVLSKFTSKEKSIYEGKLGGTIKYIKTYTAQQTYEIALQHLQSYDNGMYTVKQERIALYDDTGDLFAYAVPFINQNGVVLGHINVGAIEEGIPFYLIDPIKYNYGIIKAYSDVGWGVKYLPPFTYYYNGNAIPFASNTQTSENQEYGRHEAIPFTQREEYFNEENIIKNRELLEKICILKTSSEEYNKASAQTIVAGLTEDINNLRYVGIKDGSKIMYGGDQALWRTKGFISRTGLSGEQLYNVGCGAVAFADNILYHITKDYSVYGKLLKYTDEKKSATSGVNPKYRDFDKTFTYNSIDKTISKSEYLYFLDFYSEMGAVPSIFGTLPIQIQGAYSQVVEFTDYKYIRHVPSSKLVDTVESYLKATLDSDIPVFMFNLLEFGVETKYLLNDPVQCSSLGWSNTQDFNNHWMTITKYYKNGYSGDTFVAFSSWGSRFSINVELLKTKDKTKYYSDFYGYELQQK